MRAAQLGQRHAPVWRGSCGPQVRGWMRLSVVAGRKVIFIRLVSLICANRAFIHLLVDRRDFGHPAPPVSVFQLHHFPLRPMEVRGNRCYLLVELIEGVAPYPPTRAPSIVNWWWHCGQVVGGWFAA